MEEGNPSHVSFSIEEGGFLINEQAKWRATDVVRMRCVGLNLRAQIFSLHDIPTTKKGFEWQAKQ